MSALEDAVRARAEAEIARYPRREDAEKHARVEVAAVWLTTLLDAVSKERDAARADAERLREERDLLDQRGEAWRQHCKAARKERDALRAEAERLHHLLLAIQREREALLARGLPAEQERASTLDWIWQLAGDLAKARQRGPL